MSLESEVRRIRQECAADVARADRSIVAGDLDVVCPVCEASVGEPCALPQLGAVHLVRRRASAHKRKSREATP